LIREHGSINTISNTDAVFALIAVEIGVATARGRFEVIQSMELINEETIVVSERHSHVEAAGRQKNASGQHRANFKEDRRCNAAKGF
jgi:hypothetical protein